MPELSVDASKFCRRSQNVSIWLCLKIWGDLTHRQKPGIEQTFFVDAENN